MFAHENFFALRVGYFVVVIAVFLLFFCFFFPLFILHVETLLGYDSLLAQV